MGKGIHREVSNKFKFDYTNKWYMHNLESVRKNEMHKRGFWYTNGSANLGQTSRPSDSQQQKKRTCWIEDFAVPADHRVELQGSEKIST